MPTAIKLGGRGALNGTAIRKITFFAASLGDKNYEKLCKIVDYFLHLPANNRSEKVDKGRTKYLRIKKAFD